MLKQSLGTRIRFQKLSHLFKNLKKKPWMEGHNLPCSHFLNVVDIADLLVMICYRCFQRMISSGNYIYFFFFFPRASRSLSSSKTPGEIRARTETSPNRADQTQPLYRLSQICWVWSVRFGEVLRFESGFLQEFLTTTSFHSLWHFITFFLVLCLFVFSVFCKSFFFSSIVS